jgi:hypothetical protein
VILHCVQDDNLLKSDCSFFHCFQDDNLVKSDCGFCRWDGGFGGELGGLGGIGGVGLGGIFDLAGSAGWGYVWAGFGDGDPGLLVDVANELGGLADDAESAGVGGG